LAICFSTFLSQTRRTAPKTCCCRCSRVVPLRDRPLAASARPAALARAPAAGLRDARGHTLHALHRHARCALRALPHHRLRRLRRRLRRRVNACCRCRRFSPRTSGSLGAALMALAPGTLAAHSVSKCMCAVARDFGTKHFFLPVSPRGCAQARALFWRGR
jgi:hypothetical protein